jgi:thiol-disulfide isomerase/thioredoxin
MRKTTIILLLACCQFAFSQTKQIEAKLKGIQAKLIQREKLVDYDLIKQIKNKVVILEFWETWCGPCIQGMPHLKELKDKFPNDLQIICISSDDLKKTLTYISEHSYPFDYVFDAKKQLSAIFPHSSIPHTIVIDKKGNIKTETLPGYLTEEIIKNLISSDSIDVPFKNNFDPDKLGNNKTVQSLLIFDLKNTELGDRNFDSFSTRVNKKRIVTSYFEANAFKDTVENIQQSTLAAKNILQLYSNAYNHISEFKFIFPKDLDYINSYSPNNRYNLNYSVSSLFGDYHAVMIRQLNAAFGLETEKVEMDTTVLVLKKIEPNGRSITIENNTNIFKSDESRMTIQSFKVKCARISLHDIAILIETKTHLPVELAETDTKEYKLDILIESKGKTLEEWLPLFEKEGIFLVKEKRKAEFIRIKKVCL